MLEAVTNIPKLVWHPNYSVGIKAIDDQHLRLIEMLSDLHEAAARGKGRDILWRILHGLVEYTVDHFRLEEDLMQEHFYSYYLVHKRAHDDLIQQVKNLLGKFQTGNEFITAETLNFLNNWLKNHIVGTDKQMGAYLIEMGLK